MAVTFVVGFAVVCLAVTIAANDNGMDHLKLDEATIKLHKMDCKAETGFDYEKEDSKLTDTPAAKCFMKCMGVKIGLINEMGEPIYDKVEELFDSPEGMDAKATMKTCYEEFKDEADICEKVSDMEKCVSTEAAKHSEKKSKK